MNSRRLDISSLLCTTDPSPSSSASPLPQTSPSSRPTSLSSDVRRFPPPLQDHPGPISTDIRDLPPKVRRRASLGGLQDVDLHQTVVRMQADAQHAVDFQPDSFFPAPPPQQSFNRSPEIPPRLEESLFPHSRRSTVHELPTHSQSQTRRSPAHIASPTLSPIPLHSRPSPTSRFTYPLADSSRSRASVSPMLPYEASHPSPFRTSPSAHGSPPKSSSSPRSRPSPSNPISELETPAFTQTHIRARSHPSPPNRISTFSSMPSASVPTPTRASFSGLDALVHAASEEHRRLSVESDRCSQSTSPIVDEPTSPYVLRTAFPSSGSTSARHHVNPQPYSPYQTTMHPIKENTASYPSPQIRSPCELSVSRLFPPQNQPQANADLEARPFKRRRRSGSDSERAYEVSDEDRQAQPPSSRPLPDAPPSALVALPRGWSRFEHAHPIPQEPPPKRPASRQRSSPLVESPRLELTEERKMLQAAQVVGGLASAIERRAQANVEAEAPPPPPSAPEPEVRAAGLPQRRENEELLLSPKAESRSRVDEQPKSASFLSSVAKSKHKVKRERAPSYEREELLHHQPHVKQPKSAPPKVQPSSPTSEKVAAPCQPDKPTTNLRTRKQDKDKGHEQDAHEWLLKHYTKLSPPAPSSSVSPPPAVPKGGSPGGSPASALAAFEDALDDDWKSESAAPALADLDDELLSLVDDKPQSPHIRVPLPKPQLHVTSLRLAALSSETSRSPSVPSTPTALQISGLPFSPTSTRAVHSVSTPVTERGSMPPPPTNVTLTGPDGPKKKKKKEIESSKHAGSKLKAKVLAKPRTKKPGAKTVDASPSPSKAASKVPAVPVAKKSAAAQSSVVRSRSVSVVPGAGGEAETKMEVDKEEEERGEEDNKLYCVCKTKYDEERVMIACDRCDEWYHTQCVHMPDLEVDLVDQFICPPCINNNPQLSLRTTYKKRCYYGLKHAQPSSASACHKPSRGAFSKYCSDDCGIRHMRERADAFAKANGRKEKLWASVKGAERREGVVVCAEGLPDGDIAQLDADVLGKALVILPQKSKKEREIERLNAQLDAVVVQREDIKKQIEVVVLREQLTELASKRSEKVTTCGWDQRLCYCDEELVEFSGSVPESYEKDEGDEAMPVDGEEEWWCLGKKKCDRHAGWQKLRAAEVSFEKEMKEAALSKLTNREREIRKCIEDILEPHEASPKEPLKASNSTQLNGHPKKSK